MGVGRIFSKGGEAMVDFSRDKQRFFQEGKMVKFHFACLRVRKQPFFAENL